MRLGRANNAMDLPCIDIVEDILAFDDICNGDGSCTRNGISCIGATL